MEYGQKYQLGSFLQIIYQNGYVLKIFTRWVYFLLQRTLPSGAFNIITTRGMTWRDRKGGGTVTERGVVASASGCGANADASRPLRTQLHSQIGAGSGGSHLGCTVGGGALGRAVKVGATSRALVAGASRPI